jgi:mevalonate kinase
LADPLRQSGSVGGGVSQRPNPWASLPSEKPFLSSERMSTEAPGKAILIGEHSVVYGHRAIAVALPNLVLRVSIAPQDLVAEGATSWNESWHMVCDHQVRPLAPETREMLSRCLDVALRDSGAAEGLAAFSPQPLRIESNFPAGAGLGGSAALCVATLRLAHQLMGQGPLDFAQGLRRASRLDQIFHGTASGIDTATSFCGGLISAQGKVEQRSFAPLVNKQRFFVALVDTGTRASTALMVQRLAERRREQPVFVGDKLKRLGELAENTAEELASGQLLAVGQRLNEAHDHLSDLGLSHPEVDAAVVALRELGALGAKMTGSGGGGFALGLFRDYPQWVESFLPSKGAVYVSEVPEVSPAACERRAAVLRGENVESQRPPH